MQVAGESPTRRFARSSTPASIHFPSSHMHHLPTSRGRIKRRNEPHPPKKPSLVGSSSTSASGPAQSVGSHTDAQSVRKVQAQTHEYANT